MFFESHAHYDSKKFSDRDKILLSLDNVSHVVNVGCDLGSSKTSIELSKKYSFVYATVGFHPHNVKDMTDSDLEKLGALSKEEKVVAIGEIGLDYHYDFSPRDVQKQRFAEQLELAKKVGLPVVIHSREASKDIFDTLKNAGLSKRDGKGAGVLHCFSESAEMAKEYVKLGYCLGIGGVITYNNAKQLVKVVEETPIESLLVETDCPYLSPVPNRGKLNDSMNLKYIVDKIAEIKNMSSEDVAKVTSDNAKRLFEIRG